MKSAGIQSWASVACDERRDQGKLRRKQFNLLVFLNTKRIPTQAKGIYLHFDCTAVSAGVHYAGLPEEAFYYLQRR